MSQSWKTLSVFAQSKYNRGCPEILWKNMPSRNVQQCDKLRKEFSISLIK